MRLSDDIMKINMLCLADLLCAVLFEFIPAVIIQKIGSSDNIGPIIGVSRTIGRVFEGITIILLMRKNIKIDIPRSAWKNHVVE
ncbi:unnamed protein product [Caenorhabditis angaria]|uniref:Uncharacterized protein n=1 Tax=Caenorhabditis angaria TaxID=860376 RepID=A0A9P1IM12_9PELO|nr:unnamed protein product [Caenorhabditis angaria]